MEEQTNEIEIKNKNTVATVNRLGHEDAVDQSDLMIPRAMLIQFTPPKTVNIDPAVHTPGKIINSITLEILPTDAVGAVLFQPVKRGVVWIRFNSQKKEDPAFEPGAVIWRSNDPNDARVIAEGQWGPNNEPPKATKFINYLAHIPGHDMPIVISFGKTSFKAGKVLTTMAQFASGDLFSWTYRLRSKIEQNDQQQKYYVLAVDRGGKASPEDYAAAREKFEMYRTKDIHVHDEGSAEETEAPSSKKPWEE